MEPNLLIVMVGQPARGRESIALRLQRFLDWLNIPTKLFMDVVGVELLQRLCTEVPTTEGTQVSRPLPTKYQNLLSEYLDSDGSRLEVSLVAIKNWLTSQRDAVAIYDAANADETRRKRIAHQAKECGWNAIFVESYMDIRYHDVIEAEVRRLVSDSPQVLRGYESTMTILARRFVPLSAGENIAYVRFLYQYRGSQFSAHQVPSDGRAFHVLRFLRSVRPIPPKVFFTWANSDEPSSEYIRSFRRHLDGQELHVYLGTDERGWQIFQALQSYIQNPPSNDRRDKGVYMIKALDEIPTGVALGGKTCDQIHSDFLMQPQVEENLKTLGLSTDIMDHHVVSRTIVLAHRGVPAEAGCWNAREPETDQETHDRISSVILALEYGNPALVIAPPDVVLQLSRYYGMTSLFDTPHGSLSSASWQPSTPPETERR